MYRRLFLVCSGSNIFTALGTVEKLDSTLNNCIIWNVGGSASLILFLKCLGQTYKQIYENITKIPFINNLSQYNLDTNMKEKEKYRDFMKKWIGEQIETNSLFNKDVTMNKIYELTGFVPCFIVCIRGTRELSLIDPFRQKDMKFADAVLVSICGSLLGDIKLNKTTYIDPLLLNPYPFENIFSIEDKYIKTLYIFLDTKVESETEDLGPFSLLEENLLKNFFERSYITFKKLKTQNLDNICLLYSKFLRSDNNNNDKFLNLYIEGMKQGECFLEGRNTKSVVDDITNNQE